MNLKTIENTVNKLHDNAVRHGIYKYKGNVYTFVFMQGHYEIYENLEYMVNFNTRKITTLKKWIREYIDN